MMTQFESYISNATTSENTPSKDTFVSLQTVKGILGLVDIDGKQVNLSFAKLVLILDNASRNNAFIKQAIINLNNQWRHNPGTVAVWNQLKNALKEHNLLSEPIENYISCQIARKSGNFHQLKNTDADFITLDALEPLDSAKKEAGFYFAFFIHKLTELNQSCASTILEQTISDLNQRWQDDSDSAQGWKQLKDGLETHELLPAPVSNFIEEQIKRTQKIANK